MTGRFFSRMVLVQNKRNEAQANADCDDNYNPLHHGFPQAPLLLLTLTGKGAQDFNQRMQIIEQGGCSSDQIQVLGFEDGLRAAANIQFAVTVIDMTFNSAYLDKEMRRNLAV